MKRKTKPIRALLTKPGDTILETIEALRMSQAELAERMGRTASKVNDIITGKEPITINTALQLEKVLGVDASVWRGLEEIYREQLARIEEHEQIECYVPWAELHPLKDMKLCGFLETASLGIEAVKELLRFYGVISPQQWEAMYVPQQLGTKYRKTDAYQSTTAAITAWLRMGELKMLKMNLPDYDKEFFKKVVKEVRNLAVHQPQDFATRLQDRCAAAGVAIVYTPCISKAPISGAARWLGNNPLIQLTDRGKANDRFWFTFFHEAGHILLHGKKEVFLEEVDEYEQNMEKEKEADNFSSKWLLPDDFIEDVEEPVSDDCILSIAKKYDIHPGIVVGRLQKEELLDYSEKNKFKVRISLFE